MSGYLLFQDTERKDKMTTYQIKDRVEMIGHGLGWIAKIRFDDHGEPIYTVLMDHEPNIFDDFMLARACELRSGK